MRQVILAIVMAGLCGADAKQPDPARTELEKLQGKWRLAALESAGESRELPDQAGDRFIVQENRVNLNDKDFASLRLDPACDPKVVDIRLSADDSKGRVLEGIYCLEGDVWKICLFANEGERRRPTQFNTQAENNVIFVLRREKP